MYRKYFVAIFLSLVLGTAVFGLNTASADPPPVPPDPYERQQLSPLSRQSADRRQLQVTLNAPRLPWSKIVFQSYRDSNWEIYIGNDDGSGQTRLTNSNTSDIHPQLNRGNTQIAFASNNSGNDFEIYKMNTDGNGMVQLTNNSSDDGNPIWSPSGTKIAFESYRNGHAEIYVMNADGSGQVRLTNGSSYSGMPSWSPDGSKIAFVSYRTGGYRIWVMNANGTDQIQLSNQAYSFHPIWSPDGSKIAFDAAGADGWQNIWQMNADGSNEELVADFGGDTDIWASSWSPDGRQIAFTAISYILHQGNWYWTDAQQTAYDLVNQTISHLGFNLQDWYPRWQTSDTLPPTSLVHSLPSQSPGPIPVHWSGTDTGGSGIKYHQVQVKIGINGIWTDWFTNTTQMSGQYPGTGGNSYFFRVRTQDQAFNSEPWPNSYDASTFVENLAPLTSFSPLPPYSQVDKPIILSWQGYDPGNSGIDSYDLSYRVNNGSWVNWQTDLTTNQTIFEEATSGNNYVFRIQATDRAQNSSAWSLSSPTTFYRWQIFGEAHDNTGTPLAEVSSVATNAMASQNSDLNGSYHTYFATTQPDYSIGWQNERYLTLPNTQFPFGNDKVHNVIMPPNDNIIDNWGFESGSLGNGWHSVGSLPAIITDTIYHTGSNSTILGNLSHMEQSIVPTTGDRIRFWFDVDKHGIGHLVVQEALYPYSDFYYMQLDLNGTWSAPEMIDADGIPRYSQPKIIVTDNGRVHIFWQDGPLSPEQNIMYRVRDANGSWSNTETVISTHASNSTFHVVISHNGIIHIIANEQVPPHNYMKAFYIHRNANGWSSPIQLSEQGYPDLFLDDALLLAGQDNHIHFVWQEGGDRRILHQERLPNGTWLPIEEIADVEGTAGAYSLGGVIDIQDNIHIIWLDSPAGEPSLLYYIQRNTSGQWSSIENIHPDFTINEPQLAVSSSGIPHVIWTYQGLHHTWRESNGQWYYPQNYQQTTILPGEGTGIYSPYILIDDSDNIHLAWVEFFDNSNWEYAVFYAQKRLDQQFTVEKLLQDSEQLFSYYYPLQLALKDSASPYILWEADDTPPLFISKPKRATETGISAISTVFTIPVTMSNPILSYKYNMNTTGSIDTNFAVFVYITKSPLVENDYNHT